MEMLKCIKQLTGRSSWQQGKLLQKIATFLEGQIYQRVLSYWTQNDTTWIKRIKKITTFMNLKTSTVRKCLHIQASACVTESKSRELNWWPPTEFPEWGRNYAHFREGNSFTCPDATWFGHPGLYVDEISVTTLFFNEGQERKQTHICWSSLEG